MPAQRLQRWAGIGSIPSAGLRRIHTHQAGMSTATQQSQQKTLGWLRANVGPTLPALGRHWTAASTRTQWQHTNHHTLPSACIPAQSHYTACKQYTRDGDQRYEDSKWLISTPLSFNDPWNPKIINSISAFHVPVLLSTQTFCIQKELVG